MTRYIAISVLLIVLQVMISPITLDAKPVDRTVSIFDEEVNHAVAYYGQKKKFGKRVEFVGLNQDVRISASDVVNDQFSIEVSIPVMGFASGSNGRDKHVRKELKSDQQTSISFVSRQLNINEFEALASGPGVTVSGTLMIADESYPVEMIVSSMKDEGDTVLKAETRTTLTHFGIKPPSVPLMLKVYDHLELHLITTVTRIENWPVSLNAEVE